MLCVHVYKEHIFTHLVNVHGTLVCCSTQSENH